MSSDFQIATETSPAVPEPETSESETPTSSKMREWDQGKGTFNLEQNFPVGSVQLHL